VVNKLVRGYKDDYIISVLKKLIALRSNENKLPSLLGEECVMVLRGL
jgi:hypothetical protein